MTSGLKYPYGFRGGILCMATVMYSLFLRETATMYGDRKLGYIWVILKTSMMTLTFAAIRYAMGIPSIGGMSVIIYLVLGFTCWNIFQECAQKCLVAVSANSAMLEFPHVKPLDVMLSRCCLIVATHTIVALCIIFAAMPFGIEFWIRDSVSAFALFFLCVAFSVGFGIFLASVNAFYPTVGKIAPFVLHPMMFISGVIFSVDRFPKEYADLLYKNPLMQIIEGIRTACSDSFKLEPRTEYFYLTFLSIMFVSLGLLFEQAARRRMLA